MTVENKMAINLSVVKSSKNKDQLLVNNFIFNCERQYVNSENEEIFHWKCSSYFQTKCQARVNTKKVNQSHEIIKISKENDHNHLSLPGPIEVKKLSSNLMERSKTSNENPSVIVQTGITEVPESAHPYIPSASALKQQVN